MGFAATLALAGATPGPATLSVLARTLARGARGSVAYCAGLVLGDLVWLTTAALGLAAVAAHAPFALRALALAGAAYLVVLARGLWRAPVATAVPEVPSGWGVAQGLALQLANPKVVLFYLALLPAIVPLGRLTASDLGQLALVVAAVVSAINAVYVAFAALVRRRARSLGVLHRIAAVAMLLAAGFLAWSAA